MKDFEKLEKLLEEFKECLNDEDLEELAKNKKEENQKNIQDATKKIKGYLENKTEAIIYVNDERCVTVGSKNGLLSLFACLVDSFKGKVDIDEIVHSFIGGIALEKEMELNKDKVKEVIECLKKYL